ncbi:sperm-associated antigen 17-like [Diretmus argenteus]
MAPKRVPGLIAAPFEQDSWSACVSVVVGRSPEDEELIRALELAIQQPLRKLFTLLTWDSTLAKIRELGNPKTKKRKDVPMFYEVTEPAKVLLDAGEEIPCDLMAQILKFQLLDIRSNDQHRRAAEQAGEENPKGKAGPGSATKDKRGAKAKKPPPPIGSSKERETKLKRRAVNVEFIEAEVHGGVELAEQTRKLEMFWSDLGSVLDGGSPGSKLHDTARLSCTITDPQLPSPAQDSQATLALGRRVFESVAGLIYDCLDWRRQHQHYRDNLKLINIPTVVGLEQPPEVVVSTEQSLPRLVEAAEEPRANIVPSLDHQLASYMLRSFLPLLRTQQERSHMLNSLLTLRLVEEFGVEEAQQNADPEHPLVFRHHDERALRLKQTTVSQGFDPVEVELSLMKLSPVWDLIHSAALQRNSDPRRLACKQQLLHYCTQDGVSWPEGERVFRQSVLESMPLLGPDQHGLLLNTTGPLAQQQTRVLIPWDDPLSYAKQQLPNQQTKCQKLITEDPGSSQVLQSASEAYRCLDTFPGSHDNILYIICHNPIGPQRQCKEFWDTALHTDVGFRKYLDHVADTISDWTREEETKRKAKELRHLSPSESLKGDRDLDSRAEEVYPEPVIRNDSLKAWKLEQDRLKEEEMAKKLKKDNPGGGKWPREKSSRAASARGRVKDKNKALSGGKMSRGEMRVSKPVEIVRQGSFSAVLHNKVHLSYSYYGPTGQDTVSSRPDQASFLQTPDSQTRPQQSQSEVCEGRPASPSCPFNSLNLSVPSGLLLQFLIEDTPGLQPESACDSREETGRDSVGNACGQDGTRQDRTKPSGGENGEEIVCTKERVVLVEKEGCATVVMYPDRRNAHVFLADGTVITASSHGAYQVLPSSLGLLQIQSDGRCVYWSNPPVTTSPEGGSPSSQLGNYVMSHTDKVACDTTDHDGNHFQVMEDGQISAVISSPVESTLEEGEEEEDGEVARLHVKQREHFPRLFVVHEDGSATELLSAQTVEQLLSQADSDPTVALLKEPLPDTQGEFGITILKPCHQSVWSQWLLRKQNPNIIPANLRNRSWHNFPRVERRTPGPPFGSELGRGLTQGERSGGSSAQRQPVQSCPEALELQELRQHRPITMQLRNTLDTRLKEYMESLLKREQLSEEIKDPRTEEERVHASDLLKLVLSLLHHQTPDMRSLFLDLPPVPKADDAQVFLKDAPQEKSNSPRGSSGHYKSVQLDVTGNPRRTKVNLPTSILSSKPFSVPNEQFLSVEEPVRRKCRTISLNDPSCVVRGFQLLPSSVDFGTLREGASYAVTVFMKNVGVDICRFSVQQPPPATGLRVFYNPGPVAAGLQVELKVELFAMSVVQEGALEPKNSISQHITINTEMDILYLPVTANILSGFERKFLEYRRFFECRKEHLGGPLLCADSVKLE